MKTIFIDTETTGLSAETDEVLEIAIIDQYGNTLLDTLVKPERMESWPEAQAINGITPEMVAAAPTLKGLTLLLTGLLMQHRVVAYNMAFDIEFLKPALPGLVAGEDYHPHCAMRRFSVTRGVWDARKAGRNDYKRWRQVEAAEFVGHVWSGTAHRALADAQACRSIWQWCDSQQWRNGWTPVASGLPEVPGTYLVILHPGFAFETPTTAVFYFKADGSAVFKLRDGWYGNTDVSADVSHWMPMPVPPSVGVVAL